MKDKVRWGILGTGSIARKFAEGLTAVEDAELVAVGSRVKEGAELFGEKYGVPRRHGSYEALAKDPEVDVVYVASPHPFHKEHALLCLRNGKGVVSEKPMGINQREVGEMVACARAQKLFLMEAMWTHFFPAIRKAKALIGEGAIGEVRLMRADFCFRAGIDPAHRLFAPELGGGGLLDVGVYTVALAQLVYEQEPREIVSMANMAETGVDEQAVMLMRYEGGGMATLTCAVRTTTPHEAVIYGTDGFIRIPHAFWQPDSIVLCKDKEQEFAFERLGNGMGFEAAEVCRCMREGLLESPLMPWSRSLAVVKIMDRVRAQWGLKYPME